MDLSRSAEKHRGFGFVEFVDPEDAAAALENMNESELYGRVLKCNSAQPSSTKGGVVEVESELSGDKFMAYQSQSTGTRHTSHTRTHSHAHFTSSLLLVSLTTIDTRPRS
jgi:RNA recognition motif-containing protein